MQAREQEAQRRPLRQDRHRLSLGVAEAPDALIARDQRPATGDVEGAVRLEAPGVEADGEVVGKQVGGREIEVDQARDAAIEKEDVVGKKVGVDLTLRQRARPIGQQPVEHGGKLRAETRRHGVGAVEAAREQRPPAGGPERVRSPGRVAGAGRVQPAKRLAERAAMGDLRSARPDAGQEGGDGGMAVGKDAQRLPVPPRHRLRAGDALRRQVLHKPQKPGQIRGIDPASHRV